MTIKLQSSQVIGLGAIAAAIILSAAALSQFLLVNNLWSDEYFSLWASEPISFYEVFNNRILPDSNPVLYFCLLYLVRTLGFGDLSAILIINGAAALLSMAIAWRSMSRASMPLFGGFALAVSSLCAAMLIFLIEGRAYALAAAGGLALSAIAFGALAGRVSAGDRWIAAAVAAIIALSHVYGALFAGALAAGLVICGCTRADGRLRYDLTVLGLVIGGVASAVFLVWAIAAWRAGAFEELVEGEFWLEFTAAAVLQSFGLMKRMALGPNLVGAVIAFAVLLLLAHRRTWREAVLLCVTFAVFCLLPLLVSLHTPILHARYLAIGAPSLVFGLVMLARAGAGARLAGFAGAPTGALAAAMACAPLVAVIPLHLQYAHAHVKSKPGWYGAAPAISHAQECLGEVRVRSIPSSTDVFDYLFRRANVAAQTADGAKAPMREVSTLPCPLVGWGEHITEQPATALTDAEILQLLRLTNVNGVPLVITRHETGFVVLKDTAWGDEHDAGVHDRGATGFPVEGGAKRD